MEDLLALAIESHGGQARWDAIRGVTTELSIGGALWEIKGKAGILRDAHLGMGITYVMDARALATRRVPEATAAGRPLRRSYADLRMAGSTPARGPGLIRLLTWREAFLDAKWPRRHAASHPQI
jgi:hypothetical protein